MSATLEALGFDPWFKENQFQSGRARDRVARVTAVNKDNCLVRDDRHEVVAELSGNLVHTAASSSDLPCVGDWVYVQYYDDDAFALIDGVLPRKTFLRRKVAGKKIEYQMIAANIDTAFIVQSCDCDFNIPRLERYLVMVIEGGLEPLLLLTKSDLVAPEELDQRLAAVRQAQIHCPIIALSNKTGAGQESVRSLLKAGRTYCLVGSSGVGKTTLLNDLLGQSRFVTKTVSGAEGRGRHATSRRQLIVFEQGALLIDTPGMRELGNIGAGTGLNQSFADIVALADSCRFNDCTHTSEPGCALREALERSELSPERYQNYLKLRKESEFYQTSLADKHRKDRKFGQFKKSVMKFDKRK